MIVVAVAALFPFLGDAGREGVLIAAGVAFPVQVTVFGLLLIEPVFLKAAGKDQID